MTPDRQLGCVSVLVGERDGRYPHGNSLLVHGGEEQVFIDPSLSLALRAECPRADRVLLSHAHEDHLAGVHLFPAASCHAPEDDLLGVRSLDGLMQIYGMAPATDAAFRKVIVDTFHYIERPDARGYADGAVFDLGGGVTVRAIHAPGHTRGHSLLHVEPASVLYLGDIDLTSFGPYYGDAWSSLPDFERSLARVRELDARYYATFHQAGVIEGRVAMIEKLERFAGVIRTREQRLLAYLAEPRTLAEIVLHRFVYRPTDKVLFADDVERRSMSQHLAQLIAQGRVSEIEPQRYRAA